MPATSDQAQSILDSFPPFYARTDDCTRMTKEGLDVLQVNVGRLCNLSCKHCHMDAGPDRTEIMSRETAEQCLDVCSSRGFKVLDVTGGAPEMNPSFEWLITEAVARGIEVYVRSNLVVLWQGRYAHLPELFARLGVTVFASLPHYSKKTAEKQRGSDTFNPVIGMMRTLNDLGYGKGAKLVLNVVFNPNGALLPPSQEALERDYRERLKDDFDVEFDHLFAIANNPLGRFGTRLQETGNLERYMGKLIGAFNAETVPNMMCRSQLSVGWDGSLYDCDFNQAAGLVCKNGLTIADYARDPSLPLQREIAFGNHCYACCAGSGSS